ncbi:GNAT family N-acetyltransferase [Heyndrickxia coagulans]|uniref:Acetyltransferase, GNAT family n=2 Tax=Heyndrickxia coagulans TaxID=1398 RepID=A0A133KU92_HEYCO|nr:GNAT family N-acetyltransferase [Heyndrickxia coagulans]KWZ83161.1 acetyltransferase, GNAT family [Heyndrickxia coagulans]
MALDAVSNNSLNIFIAERDGNYLGYIELKDWIDYFTGKRQGYVSAIAVTKEAEGKGVGKLLMKKAEEWAKQKGYKELVLQVFSANEKAIKLYEMLGYEPDSMVMVKQI